YRGHLSPQGAHSPRTYAVLDALSGDYPPQRGRLLTCYSPVRHSTQGRSPFRVRLACVKHAASVRSEPGSNSPLNGRVCSPLRRAFFATESSKKRQAKSLSLRDPHLYGLLFRFQTSKRLSRLGLRILPTFGTVSSLFFHPS